MRIYPALKKIPEYVLVEGKKFLNKEAVEELLKIISDLKKVSPKDQASALCNIGIMNSYLNNFEQAVEDYRHSYSLEPDDTVFFNYLIALQRLNQISYAFDQACLYLDQNLNNKRIFEALIQIVTKYPTRDRVERLQRYRKYQNEDDSLTRKRDENITSIISNCNIIEAYGIDIDFYETFLTIALNIVYKMCKSNVEIGSIDNHELGQFTLYISSTHLEYSDIVHLNQLFDIQINSLIESGDLDKSLYFDHLSKLSLIFSVDKPMKDVA